MRWTAIALAATCLLAVAAPARAAAPSDAALVLRGLARAVEAGTLAPESAAAHRATLARAARLARRSSTYRGVLRLVARHAGRLDEARARTLFATLEVNAVRLGSAARDVEDADGVVHRRFGAHGYQFHPLANFSALNGHVAASRREQAARLAHALLGRAVPGPRGGLAWEYLFPYGGPARWTSGMAQAVAAQALARASAALADPLLLEAARGAARSAAALVRPLPEGPWIRLYSFNDLVVLNAQLQAAVSLFDYAALAADAEAEALAHALAAAAAAALPRFDTGGWSLYALGGREASLGYHAYVSTLLKRLAAMRAEEPVWREAATRFDAYLVAPPVLTVTGSTETAYPWPRDGYLDDVAVRFSLSKRSTVTLEVGPYRRTAVLGRGTHRLAWDPRRAVPGRYARVRLVAVDLAGNRAEATLPPLQLVKDTTPPDVFAYALNRVLVWEALDEVPRLSLTVRLERGRQRRLLRLGRRPLAGSTRLRLPAGRWSAVLVASDSAGNIARVDLGSLP